MFIRNPNQSISIPEPLHSLPGGYVAGPGNCAGGSRSNIAPRVDLHVLGTGRASAVYCNLMYSVYP
jgi:hypothetical protein